MQRREFLAMCGAGVLAAAEPKKPNILFILLDDLGYADIGCYGQKKILTPNIDRLAREGTRFTEAYAGGAVCAPSRCVLMTGLHGGHAKVRANAGTSPIDSGDKTFVSWLRDQGYVCGGFGKWGLGDAGSPGVPSKHGFDEFFGYLHQVHAHSYYPAFLWNNEQREPLPAKTYSADIIAVRSYEFLQRHRNKPFFLYATYTVPHGHYEPPTVAPYEDSAWPETEKKYAAMVTQGDGYAGKLLSLLKDFKMEENTLVLFASDNGGVGAEGHELEFFQTNRLPGGKRLRGQKGTLYEGGLRVPFIVRWPGRVKAGAVSNVPIYFADVFATVMHAVDGKTTAKGDGVSILSQMQSPATRPMVWEDYRWVAKTKELKPDFGMAVRAGDWKAVRPAPGAPLQLFNIKTDPGETKDSAKTDPERAAYLEAIMEDQHTAPARHEGIMEFVR